MLNEKQLESLDDELAKRARHYLRVTEWLEDSDDEEINSWRKDVDDCVQVAHDIFQRLDPQCDTATLKEVAYRQHDTATGITIISTKSVMLWPLPGRLHSFDALSHWFRWYSVRHTRRWLFTH